MPEKKNDKKLEELTDREILEILAVESRKAAKWRKISILLWAVLIIYLIVFSAIYIPKINEALAVYHSTMNNINTTLEDIQSMKDTIGETVEDLKGNVDGLTERANTLLTDLQDQVDGLKDLENRLNPFNW